MIVKGIGGIIGGLIINVAIPFIVVGCITYFVFGFYDIPTLYFTLAGMSLTSILSQMLANEI